MHVSYSIMDKVIVVFIVEFSRSCHIVLRSADIPNHSLLRLAALSPGKSDVVDPPCHFYHSPVREWVRDSGCETTECVIIILEEGPSCRQNWHII